MKNGDFFGGQFCPFYFFQKRSKVVFDTNPTEVNIQLKILSKTFTQVNQWNWTVFQNTEEYLKLCQTSMITFFAETVYGLHSEKIMKSHCRCFKESLISFFDKKILFTGDRLLITCAKFFERLTYLIPWYAHERFGKLVFWKILPAY